MLQAISQKKSTIHLRYLGARDGVEGKVYEEDELTSLLLGPLQFMPEKTAALFWHLLLIEMKAPSYTSTPPVSAHIRFWPRFPAEQGRTIEPDMFVELRWADGTIFKLIVELKWRASLSGDDQLHRQWEHCISDDERNNAFHLFIAPETSAAQAARSYLDKDPWKERLIEISWYELMGVFDDLNSNNFGVWPELVVNTLDRLGIRRFKGFDYLCYPSTIFETNQQPLFWNGPISSDY